MAFSILHFETDDYNTWKELFDSDPGGRTQVAKGHIISRNVDNPNEIFVRTEFASVDEAKSFRDRLLASGALDNPSIKVKIGPTVIEPVENVTY